MVLVGVLSDFGLKDSYVAQMKAVTLSICPSAKIIDISHEVERHNVQEGMFLLASAVPYFPDGSVFLAVVDPGVGSSRRPLLLETSKSKFVGPDNGLLVLAAESEGIINAYHLTESRYFASRITSTFHGRDIFAHVAGHLGSGVSPSLMGHTISDYVRPKLPSPKIENNKINGVILHIDGFGNVVTNVASADLKREKVEFGNRVKLETNNITREMLFCKAYSDVALGELLATLGGHGFLELAVNQGDAAKVMGVRVGNPVILQRA